MKQLRELVAKIKLFCEFDIAVVDMLDDHDTRLKRLEDDYKLLKARSDGNSQRISELVLTFGEIRRKDGSA